MAGFASCCSVEAPRDRRDCSWKLMQVNADLETGSLRLSAQEVCMQLLHMYPGPGARKQRHRNLGHANKTEVGACKGLTCHLQSNFCLRRLGSVSAWQRPAYKLVLVILPASHNPLSQGGGGRRKLYS